MDKIKVIQISIASTSIMAKDFEEEFYKNWYARVGFQLKKFHPEIDVECWAPERKYKSEKKSLKNEVKFRFFPSSLSIRHGMEISFDMLRALIEEQKKAEKENVKLVLHFHEYHAWQAYIMLLFAKCNVIAQHHGGRSPFKNLKRYKRLFLFFPLIGLMQFFENLVFKKVNVFYALSDEEIEYLKEVALNSKIKFQTMGIGDEYFKKINNAKVKLGLNENKKYVLYIGSIRKNKGIRELLDAVKNVDVELLLIGEGPDLKKYKNYGIRNVKFLGGIYGNEKLLYLSACNCLVLPSYTEGAPVVLMEAIAKNLPVIVTDVGGIPKMIKNRREGLVVKKESSKEIVKALKEILKWKKKSIRKYANKYKWKKIVEETVEDYK